MTTPTPADKEPLVVQPDTTTTIPLDSPEFRDLLRDIGPEDYECRAIITDNSGHGVVLPAVPSSTEGGSSFRFFLPEPLCIFIPGETYYLRIEVVLPTQLLTPVLTHIRIDGEAPSVADNDPVDTQPSSELDSLDNASEEISDDVLDRIAPTATLGPLDSPKVRLDEIVKQLDEEFLKSAIWAGGAAAVGVGGRPTTELSQERTPTRWVPQPGTTVAVTREQEERKRRVKAMLRSMF